MPRQKREKSITGIYHVMLRGIDKRAIFKDNIDYKIFLNYMVKAKDKSNFILYGYCLMPNHVHILLKTIDDELGDIIKRVAVGYVQYHNNKYARTGHLFQNRFKSKPIEDDNYFLTVLRYIHQNPMKANLVSGISDYKYSSYLEYITKKEGICETSYALEMFNDYNSFKSYMLDRNDNNCLGYNSKKKYSDEQLKLYILSFVNIDTLIYSDIKIRNEQLKVIKIKTMASNRQLSRVLGINRGVLERLKI